MLVCKVATSNTNGHWGEYLRVSNRHKFEFMSILQIDLFFQIWNTVVVLYCLL